MLVQRERVSIVGNYMHANDRSWQAMCVSLLGMTSLLALVLCMVGCGGTPFIGTSQGDPMRRVEMTYGRTEVSFEPTDRRVTFIGVGSQEGTPGPFLHVSTTRVIDAADERLETIRQTVPELEEVGTDLWCRYFRVVQDDGVDATPESVSNRRLLFTMSNSKGRETEVSLTRDGPRIKWEMTCDEVIKRWGPPDSIDGKFDKGPQPKTKSELGGKRKR